jgi:hypothetical protein
LNPDINPIIDRVFDLLLCPFIESMRKGVLLRGTISYGTYYLSDQLIIEALADAAYNHDKLRWIGVSLSPTLFTRINNIDTINTLAVIRYKEIPHKEF